MPPSTPSGGGSGGGYLRGLVMPVAARRRDSRSRRSDPRERARHPAIGELDDRGGRALDDTGDSLAAGIQCISHDLADDHSHPAGLERGDGPAGVDGGRLGGERGG